MWRTEINIGASIDEVVGGGDFRAQVVVAGDELGQELVQARLEDGVHVAFLKQPQGLVRKRLAAVGVAVKAAELDESSDDLLIAGPERARHLPVEDQVVGNAPGLVALAINPPIAAVGRHGAQDGRPLRAVDLSPTSSFCGRRTEYLTSRMRAVLSARSRNVPSWLK